MMQPRSRAAEDVVWRVRWLLVASCAAVVFSVVVFLVVARAWIDWSWPLFWGGVAAGAAGALVMDTFFRRGRRWADTDDQLIWVRHRRIVTAPLWIFLGVFAAVFAAAFDLMWLDVGLAAYVALCAVGAVLVLRRISRRLKARAGQEGLGRA